MLFTGVNVTIGDSIVVNASGMIIHTELRIGNRVYVEGYRGDMIESEILLLDNNSGGISGTTICHIIGRGEEYVSYHQLLPIPISNVMLGRSGFNQQGQYWVHKYAHFEIKELTDGNFTLALRGVFDGYGSPIREFHKLQNLYQAITNFELEIR